MRNQVRFHVLDRSIGFVAMIAALCAGALFAVGLAPGYAAAPASSTVPPSVDVAYSTANPPRYPLEAMQNGEQGTVLLDVVVDPNGGVVKVTVDPRGTFATKLLQQAAVDAATKWKFHPGMEAGHPVGGVVKVPVNFGIAGPCSDGFKPVGRAVEGYMCLETPATDATAKGKCLNGFRYRQAQGKSYECLP